MDEPIEAAEDCGYYSDPARNALLDRHIAVYRVGDVYDRAELAEAVPETERDKWFVAALAGSPQAAIALDIPLCPF